MISEWLINSIESILFDYNQNAINSLEESDENLAVLKFIKEYISKIAEIEEIVDKEYYKQKNSSYFFKYTYSEIIINSIHILKDIEDIFSLNAKYSKEVRLYIVKPLEGIIKVHLSLNSSVRVSIKDASLSFQQLENQKLVKNSRSKSLVIDITSSKNSTDLNDNENKDISSLIFDHLIKEKSFLSHVTNILALIRENYAKYYKEVQEIHLKTYNNSISIHRNTIFSTISSINERTIADSFNTLKEKGRNHFFIDFEKSISSEEEELKRRFSNRIGENVIASYLCAYSERILLQGKMYLTHSYLCFYSHFNSSTILGKETIVELKLSDIISIKKKMKFFIFSNSIEIKTKNSSYFFTSFISRDAAFSVIRWLLLEFNKSNYFPLNFLVETRSHRIKLQERLKAYIKTPLVNMFPSTYYTEEMFKTPIVFEISIQKAYELLFSDKSHKFLTKYLEDAGDIDIKIANWSNSAPDFFLDMPGDNWNYLATRTIKTTHRLKEKLPFMSNFCSLMETQNIHFISKEKIIIECVIIVDAPYGNYFKNYLKWTIVGGKNATITVRYGMVFSHSTIFQGKIIREGTKETIQTLNNIWLPNASKAIQLSQGIAISEAKEIRKIEQVVQQKYEFRWESWFLILILLLIILKLWQKNNKLELELKECQNQDY